MCVKAPPLDLEPEEKEPEPVPTQEEPKEPEETVKIPEHVEESVVVPDFVEKAELVIQNQCSLFVVFLCVGIFFCVQMFQFSVLSQLIFKLHENIANFMCHISVHFT